MLQMPAFRHVFLADLEWMVLPPILLNQFRLLRDGNRIVAFAAWASLSEEAEARLQQPNPRLSPAEWKSGDRLWLVHLFAPFVIRTRRSKMCGRRRSPGSDSAFIRRTSTAAGSCRRSARR
jgi:hemolysin-activating ACP:hemolysin acyltransferase